jgi:hypothetical protein
MTRTLALFVLSCVLFLPLTAQASVEWKVKLEGQVIAADSQRIRIRTPNNEIIDLVRHSVPEGFDLRPGSHIRWIAPEFKERKPSSQPAVSDPSPKSPK